MDFTTALAYLDEARRVLLDPQFDERAAAFHARQDLRTAEQVLADLMAA